MTNNMNHIESQPELNQEILNIISGTSIAWSKTKEEIWPELLEKIEGEKPATRNTKTIYLQVAKYAAAAVLALLLGISSAMYLYTKTIKTSLAKQTEVFLPDNSKVTVYAQSNLSYKPLLWMFSRAVKFEGEGLFEVQKGKKFEVVSQKGKTMVLGTQFTVYSRNNDYTITCVSGKVKVIESTNQNNVIINGGQKAVLKPNGYFEIIDNKNIPFETTEKSHNQRLDDVLNNVLSIPEEKAQPEIKKENKISVDIQPSTPKSATEKEQDKTSEQKAINEPVTNQNQAVEDLQNREQPQEKTKNKEQEQTRNQEKGKDQPTGNQQSKDKFQASLTPEQISILENKQMSREEKRKAFMQSLSPEQRQLLDEQNKERARQAENNKPESGNSEKMKEQQKTQMQEQLRENSEKENKEQQNREYKDNTKPGSNTNPGSGTGNKPETGKGN
jgi:hypothetical protein